jgi:hypothetical protein
MAEFSISVDLSGLLAIGPIARAGVFGTLSAAVERVAITGAERWREAVMRAPLWDGERRAYAASIQWRMTGPYAGEIVSDYKFVEDIETGRPARDLKRMLDTSLKVRVSAKGRRYLIIPFRHNTPGNDALARALPPAIYAQARQLSPTTVTGAGTRLSGTGAFDVKTKQPYLVRQLQYQWGSALPAGLAPTLKPHHATDIYAGLYRFQTSSGGQKSSQYLTFRTMVEGSTGWIVAPQPGQWIAKKVAEGLQNDAERVFAAAVQQDITAG